MEWTEDIVLKIIDAYRDSPVLWNPQDKYYKIVNRKNDAWNSLAKMFNVDVVEIKKKINSLLASYRRERHKVLTKISGSGGETKYQSHWFAFNSLCFLADKYKHRRIMDTSQSEEEDVGEVEIDVVEAKEEVEIESNGRDSETSNPERGNWEEMATDEVCGENLFLSPRKPPVKRKRSWKDPTINETYSILKSVSSAQRDECNTYGEHVANKLRKLDDRSRAIAQHNINNILFEAEMEMYSSFTPQQPLY